MHTITISFNKPVFQIEIPSVDKEFFQLRATCSRRDDINIWNVR